MISLKDLISTNQAAYPTSDYVGYIDQNGGFFTVQSFSDGTYSIIDAARNYVVGVKDIPSGYMPFTPLTPTLQLSNTVGFYWFDETNSFVMNPHADGASVNVMEIFLEDRPYGELESLRFQVGGLPLTAEQYQFQTNPVTGLANHLFTFTGPFSLGAGPGSIIANGPNPQGPQSGGNNPDLSIVQVYSN